jgi:hypothetical protein
MKHHCQKVENQNKEICMLIKVNYDLDRHHFNDAVQTDVAYLVQFMVSHLLNEI